MTIIVRIEFISVMKSLMFFTHDLFYWNITLRIWFSNAPRSTTHGIVSEMESVYSLSFIKDIGDHRQNTENNKMIEQKLEWWFFRMNISWLKFLIFLRDGIKNCIVYWFKKTDTHTASNGTNIEAWLCAKWNSIVKYSFPV